MGVETSAKRPQAFWIWTTGTRKPSREGSKQSYRLAGGPCANCRHFLAEPARRPHNARGSESANGPARLKEGLRGNDVNGISGLRLCEAAGGAKAPGRPAAPALTAG